MKKRVSQNKFVKEVEIPQTLSSVSNTLNKQRIDDFISKIKSHTAPSIYRNAMLKKFNYETIEIPFNPSISSLINPKPLQIEPSVYYYNKGRKFYETGEDPFIDEIRDDSDIIFKGLKYSNKNEKLSGYNLDQTIIGYADMVFFQFLSNYSFERIPNSTKKEITVLTYALVHVFWSKYDTTKKITDTNKQKWSSEYGISQNTLKSKFTNYYDKGCRQPGSNKKTSVKPFLNSFSQAVEILKNYNKSAASEAENELIDLKTRYINIEFKIP